MILVQILQRSYTFDTQISRDSATVLVPASSRFECLNKMRLALVNPINNVSDALEDRESRGYHLTGCPSFSNITLTVAHENLTSPGNPKVLSSDAPSHAFVFGSVATNCQLDALG